LQKMGGAITEQEDGFTVHGPCDLHGATCSSHHDHRIAMALAVAGAVAQGETEIEHAECIDISFPEFIPLMKKVCGEDAIRISA
jgi:3-phosphoshikimate 1-carboxyvinyltransferase